MPQCKWRWSGFHHDSTVPIEFILEEVILTWLDLKTIFMILKMVLLSEFFSGVNECGDPEVTNGKEFND